MTAARAMKTAYVEVAAASSHYCGSAGGLACRDGRRGQVVYLLFLSTNFFLGGRFVIMSKL